MKEEQLRTIALERSKKGYEWIKETLGLDAIKKLPGAQMESTEDCMLCRVFDINNFSKAAMKSELTRKELREYGFVYGWQFMRGDKQTVANNIEIYQNCWDKVIQNGSH